MLVGSLLGGVADDARFGPRAVLALGSFGALAAAALFAAYAGLSYTALGS
jgi:hypothetical protein